MPVSALTERTLTDLDHVRLTNLVRRRSRAELPSAISLQVEEVLDSCDLVPSRQVPADIVTMYSKVQLLDRATGERHELTLCYPAEADPAAGFVSVLSPVGWSLLGLRAGQVASWTIPLGAERQAEVEAVLYQPEASGDYSM